MIYYLMTAKMWLKICRDLKHLRTTVFLQIKTLDQAQTITEIATKLNFSRLTVSRSIKKLIQLIYLTAKEVAV